MTQIINPKEPTLQVADILRSHLADYQKTYPLWPEHRKIVSDLLNCRTPHLGGRIERCDSCAALRFTYHSCRNRHCPKCQHMPRERWIASKNDYLFNQDALSLVFRGKFIQRMSQACQSGNLKFADDSYNKLKNTLFTKKWVVSVRDPVKRPEDVLEYLARYTHRVAIANSRIKALKDGMVTFTVKNRKKKRTELITISAVEFIRRFLLHSLPKGFVKIRHYGFLANRNRTKNLKTIRLLMGLAEPDAKDIPRLEKMMQTLTGVDITICPCCNKGKMHFFAQIPGCRPRAPNSLVCVAG